MRVTTTEFKGKPMLSFDKETGGRYDEFNLGVTKLAIIASNIDAVIDFLRKNGGADGTEAVRQFEAKIEAMFAKA